MQANEASSGRVLLSFIGGLAVGYGLALLFAPRTGRETRDAIGSYARSTGEALSSMARNAMDAARQAAEKGSEKLAAARRGQSHVQETTISSLGKELEH